jgi:DNA polymerase I-like protein with 3'-5' exonuclease and polymerase domains
LQAVGKLREWLDRADSGSTVGLASDIETARTVMTCIGFADSASFAMCIPFIRRVGERGASFDSYWSDREEAELIWLLRRVFSHPNIRITGQNFIYDTQYIQRDWGVTPRLHHDTMLHQNVCFPGTPKALEYLSSLYCHYHYYWKEDHKEWDMKGSVEDLLRYNCIDCVRTWEIGENQAEVTRALGMEAQMQLKMETNGLCLRMMNRGVLFDIERASGTLYELNEALHQLQAELLSIIPQEWVGPVGKRTADKGGGEIYWITSDPQQKRLFYDLLGFRMVRDPKTNQPTTGGKALGQFKLNYPEFTGLIDRLELYSSIENTCNVLRSRIDLDGRIRCSYNPGGAETHRLSSSKNAFGGGTNLQNLTKGEEDE